MNVKRPWQRPGNQSAMGTSLLAADIPLLLSESDLDETQIAGYMFGVDLGRAAAGGFIGYDLTPENVGFDGERYVLFDWGESAQIELTPTSLLPWLADMRATWANGFTGLLAGFLQGLRAGTAFAQPELVGAMLPALGGRTSDNVPEWPLRPSLARTVAGIRIVCHQGLAQLDLRGLGDTGMTKEEEGVIRLLGTVLGVDIETSVGEPVPPGIDLSTLPAVGQALEHMPRPREQLGLLVLLMTELGNRLCTHNLPSVGVSCLQFAQLLLQRGADDFRYFESLLTFCIHSESRMLREPTVRRDRSDVFQTLAYCNSQAVTCGRIFSSSFSQTKGRHARNALWSSAWSGIYRIRGCEAAFAAWAQRDRDLYTQAAPGLLALVRTQASLIATLGAALSEYARASRFLPWHHMLSKKEPNVSSEFDWCRETLQLATGSSGIGANLVDAFEKLPGAVDVSRLGIHDTSFLPRC
jgi:hypothetical protein